MTKEQLINSELGNILDSYPKGISKINSDFTNVAISIYGRRYYKDQTPVEYLSEFLLVFSSPKTHNNLGAFEFNLSFEEESSTNYYPENKLLLKLFSFFPNSKLETRHLVHRNTYLEIIDKIKERIKNTDQEEAIRLIQSLLCGFVGVGKNRTWVTHNFLPITSELLGREIVWSHAKAKKNKNLKKWEDSKEYFSNDRHIFMARGGELLYLQLANLFSDFSHEDIKHILKQPSYSHLLKDIENLQKNLEYNLSKVLNGLSAQINVLIKWIDLVLDEYNFELTPKNANLGWVPLVSRNEALLFAVEMNNICLSKLSPLDKIDLLQTLCCVHVLRSLCFQARRIDTTEKETKNFIGNYCWIVADPDAPLATPIRQLAQNSFLKIESLLYRVIKKFESGSSAEAEKHGFQIFRKIAKEIGLVIPPKGQGQRFTLNQSLLRFLVAAVIRPGERIRLDHFYQRVFAHYGIALGNQQLAVALSWCGHETQNDSYAVASNTVWVEEALQQGGFLVELSDAVSMVINPGTNIKEPSTN